MIRITIGNSERSIDEAKLSWLREQIESRRNDGTSVCVKVLIKSGPLNLLLATPCCGGSVGGRAPSPEELKILRLWEKRGMNHDRFEIAQLAAFLNEIKHA
jgi:hypothetical protein